MTDKTPIVRQEVSPLRTLIKTVGVGEINIGKGATLAFIPLPPERRKTAMAAYHGSLDAAKSLHEALLPGWGFSAGFDEVRYFSDVFKKGNTVITVTSSNPARSWLLAILKAYEASTKEK